MSARAIALAAAAAFAALAALLSAGHDDRSAAATKRAHARWKQVFVDDFSRGLDTSHWLRYSGQPGGDPGGWWDPSHATVTNGVLNLETYRMDAGRGVLGVMLLWPSINIWPPEIDFAETGGTTNRRDKISATLHHGADNQQIPRVLHGDFTQWHTAGVEWTPGKLVYTLDGRRWGSVRGQYVPDMPMELDIQAQAGTCGQQYTPCPGLSTPAHVNLQVDRVAAYRYVPPKR